MDKETKWLLIFLVGMFVLYCLFIYAGPNFDVSSQNCGVADCAGYGTQ